MEDSDDVQRLQAEVMALEKEMKDMHARLQQVQQQLRQLYPKGADRAATPTVRTFSLENFIGLRLIHLVGIVVLVIGVSIGVKYAFDRNLISEVTRIILAYAAGATLFLLSIQLKKKYAQFSAILFSGAMATFYFTSYAAHVYYGLIPFGAVFGLMVLLTVFTAYEAVRYNRYEIALLGLIGAYGIPFLISRNADRAELLFLYIAIINLGVLYLQAKKEWSLVSRLALVLSWTLFVGWASTRFEATQWQLALFFLVFFFLLFLLMMLVGQQKGSPVSRGASRFLLLNTVAAFVASLFLFAPAFGEARMAYVAFLFTFIAALQGVGTQTLLASSAYLRQAMYFLSVFFLVLTTAFYYDGLSVTFVWLALSVALFAMGVWLRDKIWRMAALSLMALTLMKLLVIDSQRFSAGQKVIAYVALGLLLLVVSFFYQKFRQKWFEE